MNQELRIKGKKNSIKTIIHYSLFIFGKSKGFTLIELLWSIAIASVLSSVGIAAFFTYSRQQALQSAVSDFTTMLTVAKSRAQSQVKPSDGVCVGSTNRLEEGYKVYVQITSDHQEDYYQLATKCSGQEYLFEKNYLPKGMRFDCISDSTKPYFSFQVLSGTVDGSRSVSISAYGYTKTVSVTGSGVIQLGGSCSS